MVMKHSVVIRILVLLAIAMLLPILATAHNVSKRDATFVQANTGAAVAPFLYLGAKHMVTGYDHLLFLVGVIFFLYRLRDVVQYVSLFTIGHSLTLLGGVLVGLSSWRTRPGFLQHAFLTNTVLMVGGFILVGYQLTGYFVA